MGVQQKIMLLGSGELGKEFVISCKRLGQYVIAVDRYQNAPAMQVADEFEVINMLDAKALQKIVAKHKPTHIVPEIEAIRTEKLQEFEAKGVQVVPTAEATYLTMNRDAIRDVAAKELKLKTAKYAYAESLEELLSLSDQVGFPCVVKPVQSSSGKGQSTASSLNELKKSWEFAVAGMRGDKRRIIIEEFVSFDFEITLLTIKQKKGKTLFVDPIGHRQERGDYQESWIPAKMTSAALRKAQRMAKKVTDRLGGAGLFGVEFFVKGGDVYFSELSPRPHDTGMVTLISQDLSEFDLHARAVLGLPIPVINYRGPSASSVILAKKEGRNISYAGIEKALSVKNTELRIFGKPDCRPYRRMGVALATGASVSAARKKANQVAGLVKVKVRP